MNTLYVCVGKKKVEILQPKPPPFKLDVFFIYWKMNVLEFVSVRQQGYNTLLTHKCVRGPAQSRAVLHGSALVLKYFHGQCLTPFQICNSSSLSLERSSVLAGCLGEGELCH